MIGGRPILLALLVLAGCGPVASHVELAEPLVVQRVEGPPSCGPGLRLVDRLEVGGGFGAVVADDRWIYAATGTAVRLFSLDGPPVERVVATPGEARDLLLAGGRLWIADGSGGLARLDRPQDAAGELVSWHVGGDLVAITESGGAVWAADSTGRVLRLPVDAGPDRSPDVVEVDGAPVSVAAWGDGVLVAAGGAGLLLVEPQAGELTVRAAPWELAWPSRLTTHDGVVYAASGQEVHRFEAGAQATSVEVPRRALGLLAGADGVLIAAQASGLHAWDGRSEETASWDGAPIAGRSGLSAEGLHLLADDRLLLAGGYLGIVEATRVEQGWRAGRVWGSGGEVVSLASIGDELVVGIATWNNAGRLVALGDDGSGRLRELRSVDAGGWPEVVVPVQGGLAVARRGGGGLGFVGADWSTPVELVALEDSTVNALARAGEGQLVTGSMDRTLHWLERTDEGAWEVVGSAELNRLPMPVDVVVHDGAVLTATGAVGMAWRWRGPGTTPEPTRALAGSAAESGGVVRLGRMLLDGAHVWVSLPAVGLERVSFEAGEGEVFDLSPGAWDVVRWGDELAIARGEAGVSLMSAGAPGEVLSSCDLPGPVRRLAVWGDRLVASADGTVFVLER